MTSCCNIEIIPYSHELKDLWDEMVLRSKNGTFILQRDYMDYHSDRFVDNSLIVYRKGKPYCLLPASVKDDTVSSHGGLTYGGLIMSEKCTAEGILDVFATILDYYRKKGYKNLIYKPIPYIYHSIPSQEDLYALFRHNANLKVRNISSTINLNNPLKFIKDRRAALRKAESFGISVSDSQQWENFWDILNHNLNSKYGAKPVHSLSEILSLHSKFPGNIKLYTATGKNNEIYAGLVAYITPKVVHAQYISASPEGKEHGAVDAIINFLVNTEYKEKAYFDLGTSNEEGGKILNESLIYQKEGFGGRAVCYDTYEINLTETIS